MRINLPLQIHSVQRVVFAYTPLNLSSYDFNNWTFANKTFSNWTSGVKILAIGHLAIEIFAIILLEMDILAILLITINILPINVKGNQVLELGNSKPTQFHHKALS